MARAEVADLFERLAEFAAPGSRLAVSFERGFQEKPIMRRVMTAYYRGRETFRFRLEQDEAPAFVSATGWAIEDVLPATQLAPAYLAATKLAGAKVGTPAFLLVATAPAPVRAR